MQTQEKTSSLKPPFERYAYLFEAHMALKEFRFQTALKKCLMAYRLNPDCFYDISYLFYKSYILHKQSDTLSSLAEFYLACDKESLAIDELEDVFDQDPQSEALYRLLSSMYNKGLELPRVLKLCEKALNLQIYHQSIVDVLSVHYVKTHAYLKNIQLYKTLIQLKPKQAHFYLTLAELHLRNQDPKALLHCLRQLYQNDKSRHADIMKVLQRLLDHYPSKNDARLFLIEISLNHIHPTVAEKHSLFLLDKANDQHLENQEPISRHLLELLKPACTTYPDNVYLLYYTARAYFLEKEYVSCIQQLKKSHQLNRLKPDLILKLLNQLLNQAPQHLSAYLLKLDILEEQTQFDTLYELINQLLDHHPDLAKEIEKRLVKYAKLNPEDHLIIQESLAKCHYIQKNYEQCLTLCDVLLARQDLPSIHALRIQALSQESQFSQAFDAYAQLLEKHKLQQSTFLAKAHLKQAYLNDQKQKLDANSLEQGLIHLANHQTLEALKHFQGITQEHPDYYKYQACCGRCFVEMGRFDLANDQFNLVLQHQDGALTNLKDALLYWMCLNYLCLGDLNHAIHHMEQIYKSNMHFQHIDQKLAYYQNQVQLDLRGRGLCLVLVDPLENELIPIACQNPENAEHISYNASFQTLSFAQTHNNEGVRQLLNKHISTAEASFLLAKQLEPNLPIIKSNIAMCYLSQNHLKQSQKQLIELEESHEGFAIIYLIRTLQHLLLGELSQAKVEATKATEHDSIRAIAHFFLGDIAFREQLVEEAKKHWGYAKEESGLFFLLKRRDTMLSKNLLSIEHWLGDFSLQL